MLAKLKGVVAELKKHKSIEISEHAVRKPASKAALASASKTHGLGPKVLGLWSATNGFTLQWTGTTDDAEARGGIIVPPLDEVLGSWDGSVYFDDTPETDLKRKFHPVDTYDGDMGSGQYVGLLLDGTANPRVLYHDSDLELHELSPDLDSYLDLFVRTRGFLYWQSALIAQRDGEHVDSEFAEVMPGFFPTFDLKKTAKTLSKKQAPKPAGKPRRR